MINSSNALLRLALVLVATTTASLLAGGTTAVTPEPSLVVLTAVGVGAVILIARKKRGR
jgi:hypothetical protein